MNAAAAEELDPYLLYRTSAAEAECALWRLTDGERALALFRAGDAATTYRAAAGLGPEWKLIRPEKPVLRSILEASLAAGIRFAVLDPDGSAAKRIFEIDKVLAAD